MPPTMDKDRVTLGGGDLYLNNVLVGTLKGTVEFEYNGTLVPFKPQHATGAVKVFRIEEKAVLRASLAEIEGANFKLAMGVTTAVLSSQSFPSYDPSSYTVPASASYDILHFGGSKTVYTCSIRFEHTIPGTTTGTIKRVVIVFYSCYSPAQWKIPFNEDTVTLQDVEFEALCVDSRAAGDQMGFIAHQVQGAV